MVRVLDSKISQAYLRTPQMTLDICGIGLMLSLMWTKDYQPFTPSVEFSILAIFAVDLLIRAFDIFTMNKRPKIGFFIDMIPVIIFLGLTIWICLAAAKAGCLSDYAGACALLVPLSIIAVIQMFLGIVGLGAMLLKWKLVTHEVDIQDEEQYGGSKQQRGEGGEGG